MERENIIQGREVVAQYRQAHNALHQESLTASQMTARHQTLAEALVISLSELGFGTVGDFDDQNQALQQLETEESLRNLKLPAGDLLRFVDLTGYSLVQQFALLNDQRARRAADQIPDTAYLGGVFGLEKPIVICDSKTVPGDFSERVTTAGATVLSITSNRTRVAPYLYQHNLVISIITFGRFEDDAAARQAASAVCARTLFDLGVTVDVLPGRNNIKVGNKKLASSMAYLRDGVGFTATVINLDFDAVTAATILGDAEISQRTTSLREVLGQAVNPETLKTAAHQAVAYVFDAAAVTTTLSERELTVLQA